VIKEKTIKALNKYVDEYIDGLRFEFIYLEHNREIKEIESGKFVVQDSDIIIDTSKSHDEILRHPLENYFIPEKVNLFVVEFIVTLDLPSLENLIDLDVTGVIRDEEIPIEDARITDKQLIDLLSDTCFNVEYQASYPEVKAYLKNIYTQEHPSNIQNFLIVLVI
jgi:hypothetical protein